jgi:hypothetical protein
VLSLFRTYPLRNIINTEFLVNVNALLSSTTEITTTTTTTNNNNNNRHHARTQQILPAVVQVSAAHRKFERSFVYFKRYPTNYYILIIDVTDTVEVKR